MSAITNESLEKRNITPETWRVLRSLYPDNAPETMVMLAVDYCRARDLDPIKKPVHLVQYGGTWQLISGILEQRITAVRTGQYAGRGAAVYGDAVTVANFAEKIPATCRVTVYKIVNGQRCEFVGPLVLFAECVGKKRDGKPMGQWATRPWGMFEKVAEAAALRAAFPEEIGDNDIISATPETEAAPSGLAVLNSAIETDETETAETVEIDETENGETSTETDNGETAPAPDSELF